MLNVRTKPCLPALCWPLTHPCPILNPLTPPHPPPRHHRFPRCPFAAPGAAALECTCGAVNRLHVGFVLIQGAQYVSTIGIECSSGESLSDPSAARINLIGTVASRVVSRAAALQGCAALLCCHSWGSASTLPGMRAGLCAGPPDPASKAQPCSTDSCPAWPDHCPAWLEHCPAWHAAVVSLQCPNPEPNGGCASLTGSVVGVTTKEDTLLAFSRLQDAGAPWHCLRHWRTAALESSF